MPGATDNPYPMNAIPPLGAVGPDDHSVLVTELQNRAQEAQFQRDRWVGYADRNRQIFIFGAPLDQYDPEKVYVTEIQSAVICATDIQTKEPPSVTLEPVETGEEPTYYWAGPDDVGIRLGLPTPAVSSWIHPETGQQQPPIPMDPDVAEQLLDQAAQVGMVMGPDGQPMPLKEEWIVAVDDALVAEVYQSVFDVYWARSGTDRWVRQNLLTTNIQGWIFGLYEFDDAEQRDVLTNVSVRQIYIDPTVEDIQDAAYAGIDLVLDADKAKKLYQHLADAIDREKRTGTPMRPDSGDGFGNEFEQEFRRPMVVLRVFWLRDAEAVMSLDEALQGGHVEQRLMGGQSAVGSGQEMPGQPGAAADADQQQEPISEGADQLGAESDRAAAADGGAGSDLSLGGASLDENPESSGAAAPDAIPGPAARVGHFLRGSDDELTLPAEGEPMNIAGWPTKRILRQITTIANTLVDDRVCEHWDIPLLHNVNIPIPGRPFGLGEPFRLWAMQNARNRMIDSLVEYTEAFANPASEIPESVAKTLEEEYGDAYIKPHRTIRVPDELRQMYPDGIVKFSVPPPLPEAVVKLQQILKTEITEQSGHSEVLQGQASSQLSGKAIETLQTAAASMIGFKSQRTGDMVYRLARLKLHSYVWRLTCQDVSRIVRKYKYPILEAVCERAKEMDWEVSVTVSSGNGAIKTQKQNQSLQKYKDGLQSKQTTQDEMGIDARKERKRFEQQAEDDARLQRQLMPAPMPGQGGGGQGTQSQPASQ